MIASKVSSRALAVFLALALLPFELVAQSTQPVLPDPGRPSMNRDQQEKIGLQAVGEVYQQFPVLPDSNPVSQYVQQLGRKLVTVIPADRSWPYQFHVIPAADINAFALPGGPIFVNLGTILAADNEAELAGVMAHEASHVYMQHSAKQAPKAAAAQILAGLAGAVLGGGVGGSLAQLGIQFGAGTLLMKYSRKDEAQADSVGAIIMYQNGYNPQAMADFFLKLEQKYGKGGPQFMSDHPNPGNRQTAIQKEIKSWPRKSYLASSNAFTRARQTAGGIKAYTAQEIEAGAKQKIWSDQNRKSGAFPSSAAVEGGPTPTGGGPAPAAPALPDLANVTFKDVQPSGRFTQYQQSGLSISYPDNWKAVGDQNSITIAHEKGVGEAGLAYGVMISAANLDANALDQSTQQLIQGLQQGNPGMKTASELKSIYVSGLQGRSIYLRGNSPVQRGGQPVPEKDWLITVPRPGGGLLYLVFVSTEQDFNQLDPTYQKMLSTFQVR